MSVISQMIERYAVVANKVTVDNKEILLCGRCSAQERLELPSNEIDLGLQIEIFLENHKKCKK